MRCLFTEVSTDLTRGVRELARQHLDKKTPISQIPQSICPISHNAPFRTEMCTFLFRMVHCGIWDRYIVVFVNLVYWLHMKDDTQECFSIKMYKKYGLYSTQICLYIQLSITNNSCPYTFSDDVMTWKHFPRYWSLAREIHLSPIESQ